MQSISVKVPEILKPPTSYMTPLTSQIKIFTAVDHILISYDMRNLSKFYASSGNAEKAAYALLKLEKDSSITILTGFCVTERFVNNKKVPVAETDGPPDTAVAGKTLRKLFYRVSYVADPVTCNVLRACLKAIKAADTCVHEFYSHHDEKEQIAEAQRLINQLKPKAMLAGELCSRKWNDGVRHNMKGKNINHWNPPLMKCSSNLKVKVLSSQLMMVVMKLAWPI
jgi:hypothetical protein